MRQNKLALVEYAPREPSDVSERGSYPDKVPARIGTAKAFSCRGKHSETSMRKYPMLDKLFDGPNQWTQGVSARDIFHEPVENYRDADCWCLAGMLEHVFGIKGLSSLSPIVLAIIEQIRMMWPDRITGDSDPIYDIIKFNDHFDTTFEDVQFVLKWADVSLAKEKVMV